MRLYRFFEKKCHADMFLAGYIRFTELSNFSFCKNDVRFDDRERVGRSLVNSVMHTNYIANEIYSLSFSTNKIDRFGSHCIYVDDLHRLVDAINYGLERCGITNFPSVDHGLVSYNKDQSTLQSLNFRESILQKPDSYVDEHEYRIFFVGSNKSAGENFKKFIFVKIEHSNKFIFSS